MNRAQSVKELIATLGSSYLRLLNHSKLHVILSAAKNPTVEFKLKSEILRRFY